MNFLSPPDQTQFGPALTFSYVSRVLVALLLSLLMHVPLFFAWLHLQAVSDRPIIVQGELLPPMIEEPPPRIEPLPSPPQVEPEPLPSVHKPVSTPPKHETPKQKSKQALKQASNPAPKQAPDTGVALPLLAEKASTANVGANDHVVPQVQPLAPDDKLPFASVPGETPLEQYIPPTAPSSKSNEVVTPTGNGESPVDRGVLAEYGQGLGERAQQFSSYPMLALNRGWEGRVKVLVKYDRNGVAYQIAVKDSSGQQILDDQALDMVKKACAGFALPAKLVGKTFSVIVPIDFMLIK
jgi:protein TonB